MRCSICGNEIDPSKKFCKHCGNPIPKTDLGVKTETPQSSTNNPPSVDNTNVNTSDGNNKNSGNRGKNQNGIIIGLIVCLAIALIVIAYLAIQGKNKNNNDAENNQQTTAASESDSNPETDFYAYDTESESAAIEDINHTVNLDYCDSYYPNYPTGPSSFIEVSNSDYALKYPMDFFNEGIYDYEDNSYYFATGDGDITLRVTQYEAPYWNDPKRSANYLLSESESDFVLNSQVEKLYEFSSKEVAENGFSRSIIAGQSSYDPSRGAYILHVCNNSTVYELRFDYPLDTTITNGNGITYTPLGYALDCIYRGFSISGSTYKLRSFDEYQIDDMGTKK